MKYKLKATKLPKIISLGKALFDSSWTKPIRKTGSGNLEIEFHRFSTSSSVKENEILFLEVVRDMFLHSRPLCKIVWGDYNRLIISNSHIELQLVERKFKNTLLGGFRLGEDFKIFKGQPKELFQKNLYLATAKLLTSIVKTLKSFPLKKNAIFYVSADVLGALKKKAIKKEI